MSDVQVNGGGTLDVGYSGSVDHVAALGTAGYYGGQAAFAVISAHGDGAHAIVTNYTISNYARAYASNGGEFLNGSINGGTVEIGSGSEIGDSNIYGSGNYTNTATANQTQNYVNVLSGGIASGITTFGGSLNIGSGGFVESSHASSGYINVATGGSGTGNTIFEGGQLNALGGTLTDSTLSGGELWVSSGGKASGVQDGSSGSAVGRIYVSNGTLDDATVNGGTVFVGSKGIFENSILSGSGTLSNTDTANHTQDYANITSGGYASGITTQGGSLNVSSGASVDKSTASAGYINIQSGASGTGNTVAGNQAQLNVLGGTLTSSTVIAGEFNVQNGGKANIVAVSGGVLKDDAATVTSATIGGSGSANIISGGVLSASTVTNGGVVNVDSTSKLSGETTISNGGQLILNGSAGNGSIVMEGASSLLTISGDTMPTNVISGLQNGGRIDLVNLKNVTMTQTTSNGIDFLGTDESGKTVDFHLNIPNANTIGYKIIADGHGGLYYEVCFLPGSMIRTVNGDIAVENLQIGDPIVAFDWKNNKDVVRSVVWAGKAHATVRPGLPADEAGYPVRVLKNAIADGVPYKDMLITPEHCLFFDGQFVPARMLVNGKSIFYDTSITSYDYYHVETEEHSVITADGMLTESYLDTGNRSSFHQEGTVISLRSTVRTWEHDAGAPLCVDRAFVEPLFHKLDARNNMIGSPCSSSANAELIVDPDLHLMTESGATIRPIRREGQRYSFMLPANISSVRIVSRASRPADVVGPFVDDRRMMGVAVADVHLVAANKKSLVTSHLQAVKPAGWHSTEWTDCAWTNGDAVLPLGDLTQSGMGILSLNIRAAGPYLKTDAKPLLTSIRSA
ncbi:Hint domain-containing protein [Acetobacter malorum]|uniref:Hint domain-containing protein n=1 Tax=Acetobacter malorum TaxID=178901 RepID=UPI00211B1270|nr:Hint domain-containing protein [Acetobacter malorum]